MALREVTVESGRLSGRPCGNPGYSVFFGIPYAAPPIGELRWRAPQPPIPWSGVRDAAKPRTKLMQGMGGAPNKKITNLMGNEFYPYEEEMDEGSLFLNVWTPASSENEKLPVYFWVHGGGFGGGYGSSMHFDGQAYNKRGVILVTINYRLGILGYLVNEELNAESEHGVSGNYGLLDMIAALKWVRRNIAAFGGDPERITIGGQSSGAMAIEMLTMSPLTKGDYVGAIMQSGGGPMPIVYKPTHIEEALQKADLFKALGVKTIKEARAIPADEIMQRARQNLPNVKMEGCYEYMTAPVIDGYVLPESYGTAGRNGNFHDVNYLMGFMKDDGVSNNKLTVFLSTEEQAKVDFVKEAKQMAEDMFEDKKNEFLDLVPLDDYPALRRFWKFETTENLWAGAAAFAEFQEMHGRKAPYVYCITRELPGDDRGAFHAGDLWYTFQTFMRGWRPFSGIDYELSCNIVDYWCNFIKTGDPNCDALPEWRAYTHADPAIMELGEKCITRIPQETARVEWRKKYCMTELD